MNLIFVSPIDWLNLSFHKMVVWRRPKSTANSFSFSWLLLLLSTVLIEVRRIEHLPDFQFTFVGSAENIHVQFHKVLAHLERFLLRLRPQDGVTPNHLLGLDERPIRHRQFAAR